MLDLGAVRISSPGEVGPAWEGRCRRPSVRHRRHVDPNVLAVPPHVTMEQTKNYLAAILKGDREAAKTVWQSFKQAFT